MVLAGLFAGPHQLAVWRGALVGVPLVVLLATLPFMVRGYVLTERHIEVRRLGWRSLLPLAGLVAVTVRPVGSPARCGWSATAGRCASGAGCWNPRSGGFRSFRRARGGRWC